VRDFIVKEENEMEFTADELCNIEKMADMMAVETQKHHAAIIEAFEKVKMKGTKKAVEAATSNIFKESVKAYNMLRTISAKCEAMRKALRTRDKKRDLDRK
jgi:antirestriction protein ArdC